MKGHFTALALLALLAGCDGSDPQYLAESRARMQATLDAEAAEAARATATFKAASLAVHPIDAWNRSDYGSRHPVGYGDSPVSMDGFVYDPLSRVWCAGYGDTAHCDILP